ncbi:MAG: hypothetical protein KBT87_01205 [Gammaproteobacteria bacterium]|jgi:hypothetical protein|nr:hypothetical protein [Gammaproteobacteria bacterium]MBQ0773269.1 hypothetical protein [Gammaproteobacteria bacterium]|tara:strand:+ start:13051 stop:13350 length:300 start_codon:yes stop_codon:yes gene_type:complete
MKIQRLGYLLATLILAPMLATPLLAEVDKLNDAELEEEVVREDGHLGAKPTLEDIENLQDQQRLLPRAQNEPRPATPTTLPPPPPPTPPKLPNIRPPQP